MINNSSNSNSKKNEIVFTSAISEQIPMIINDTEPIIANDDTAITTLCCLNLVNKFCIVLTIPYNTIQTFIIIFIIFVMLLI